MILFLTNIDTDILSFSMAKERLEALGIKASVTNPTKSDFDIKDAKVIVFKRLGNAMGFETEFANLVKQVKKNSAIFIAISAERVIDLAFEANSTVSPSVCEEVGKYFRASGEYNLIQGFKLISNLFYNTSFPIGAVRNFELLKLYKASNKQADVAVLFYLAHLTAKNTGFIDVILSELANLGISYVSYAVYALRDLSTQKKLVSLLKKRKVKIILSALWAAGKITADGWESSYLTKLEINNIQLISSLQSIESYLESPNGISAFDVVSQVAIPEFEGRIISVPVSFKQELKEENGLTFSVYRSDPERVRKVVLMTARQLTLLNKENSEKKLAIILSAYPSKKSRLGNAVGLDTPKSLVNILSSLKANGYDIGDITLDSEKLMKLLADGLFYEDPSLNAQQVEFFAQLDVGSYKEWFDKQSNEIKEKVVGFWGEPPGEVLNDGKSFKFAGISSGKIVIAIQPPRGFGFNPIAIYHSPDLPPPHHYLAFYLWMEKNVDAIIHLGKHGTLEWLSGKSVGLSRACLPDAALYSLPVIYPFVVNDPGEGVQAKRRTHAQIVDHLVPPLTAAGTYGDLKHLETLLDEHANATVMNPEKLPAIRREIAKLVQKSNLAKDLNIELNESDLNVIDELIPEIDGYLCEIKDAVIRGGLHVFGQVPDKEKLVDTIVAITSVRQLDVPSLDELIQTKFKVSNKKFALKAQESDYKYQLKRQIVAELLDADFKKLVKDKTLKFIKNNLYPNLKKTTQELDSVLKGLAGKFIEPGPAGAPSRGMAHVLPTGRNFYGVDPRAIPTPLAYEVGKQLADQTIKNYVEKKNQYPKSIAIVIWATACMRTGGDDIAHAMALAGLKPEWDPVSGRVVSIKPVEIGELKRPRIDVTLRISGLFRDAFYPLIEMLDQAFKDLGKLTESGDNNPYVYGADVFRFYGPKPGSYGSGILNAIETKNWKNKKDLASIYLNWSCYGYGIGSPGDYAYDQLVTRLSESDAALKNQDNREHDIFDSDDYFQDHGGLIAAISYLSKKEPLALFGDSSRTDKVKVRPLIEEARKVIRSRVINPKWINAMKQHGYKGAFEIAATVDYVFGYGATADIIEDWAFEEISKNLALDDEIKRFFYESNPWALAHICERLLEAARRKVWKNPDETITKELAELLLEVEGLLE